MVYTDTEVANMYGIWLESGTNKEFKEYWGLTSAEMVQINKMNDAEDS